MHRFIIPVNGTAFDFRLINYEKEFLHGEIFQFYLTDRNFSLKLKVILHDQLTDIPISPQEGEGLITPFAIPHLQGASYFIYFNQTLMEDDVNNYKIEHGYPLIGNILPGGNRDDKLYLVAAFEDYFLTKEITMYQQRNVRKVIDPINLFLLQTIDDSVLANAIMQFRQKES